MTTLNGCEASGDMVVRKAAVSGQFYSGNPRELRAEIERYVAAGKKLDTTPRMIIGPHAGYVFSGPVAGIGFATIDRKTKRVILLGPSHHAWFTGVSIPDVDAYETPLGTVRLDREAVETLRKSPIVVANPQAHTQEHCLEVQIPFLQVLLSDFTIVPVIAGKVEPEAVADLLRPLLDGATLLIASSDLSHYLSSDKAKRVDAESIKTILDGNTGGAIDACGETPIRVVMHLAHAMGLEPHLLDARNSYETAPRYGSDGRVVGYASIVFTPSGTPITGTGSGDGAVGMEIGEGDRKWLLGLARAALERAARGDKPPSVSDAPAVAGEVVGCFVTLTKRGDLRGCIGYIEGIKPLYQAVIDNAGNAALGDPRFPNVTPDELDAIKVEISVLTRPEPLPYDGEADLLAKLVPGRDGLVLRKGFSQSTFLPQVWDQLPDRVTFLEHLSRKAGLGRDDWKRAEYRRYFAIHFQEGD